MIMDIEEIKRVEELKHNEELLYNTIEYLVELWGINEKEKLEQKFKTILGFTDNDLIRLGIKE